MFIEVIVSPASRVAKEPDVHHNDADVMHEVKA
jgi:hypothetical protein